MGTARTHGVGRVHKGYGHGLRWFTSHRLLVRSKFNDTKKPRMRLPTVVADVPSYVRLVSPPTSRRDEAPALIVNQAFRGRADCVHAPVPTAGSVPADAGFSGDAGAALGRSKTLLGVDDSRLHVLGAALLGRDSAGWALGAGRHAAHHLDCALPHGRGACAIRVKGRLEHLQLLARNRVLGVALPLVAARRLYIVAVRRRRFVLGGCCCNRPRRHGAPAQRNELPRRRNSVVQNDCRCGAPRRSHPRQS